MARLPIVLALATAAFAAAAQAPAPVFPAGAQPVAAEALRARLAGKAFKAAGGTMKPSRLQYNDNGYVYLNVSSGYRDTGKWRVEESKLCTDWQQTPTSGCSEARVEGEVIYVQRPNGEVIAMKPE